MTRHAPGLPAHAIFLVVGMALASSGSLSARAEPPASQDEATGFLSTLFPDPLAASDAPVCRLDDPHQRSTRIDTGARIGQIRSLIAAQAAASSASGAEGDFVAISNRGYNYQPDTIVDPALIEFEARHQRR